jgi:tetratricopeptide (TPR) repeat protein
MRLLLRLVLLGLVIATASSPRALADPADPARDPAAVKLAKQYVDAGLAAQDAHDYDTAITLYSRAHELVPHPLLIFNLAQAHRLAGHADKALALYRRYLAEDPEGIQAAIARSFVAALGERAAAKQRAAEPGERAPGPARTEADRADGPDEPVVERSAAAEPRATASTADHAPPSGAVVIAARNRTGAVIPHGAVLVDGERRGQLVDGKLVIPRIAGGSHTIAIEADGYQRFEQTAMVRGGERATLDAALVDAPSAPPSNHRAWKWALGVSGGLAVGSGLFTVYAFERQQHAAQQLHSNVTSSDCGRGAASLGLSPADQRSFDQACAWHSRTVMGEWVTLAALAASTVSLVMVLREPGTPEPGATATRGTQHEVAIAPIVAPGTGGASLSVTW